MGLDGEAQSVGGNSEEFVTADFAGKLRTLRLNHRLTQEVLAQRAGLSTRTVRDIERGKVHFPRAETIRLIGAALGLRDLRLAQFVEHARSRYWRGRQMST